jgi:hypothetical protein
MAFIDDTEYRYSAYIDQRKLGRLVRRAAENKNGTARAGAIVVASKKLK